MTMEAYLPGSCQPAILIASDGSGISLTLGPEVHRQTCALQPNRPSALTLRGSFVSQHCRQVHFDPVQESSSAVVLV
ncbi:hypothetical protein CEXT_237571 [Caerostris extrusa]|uniref:Uncharacterized protein n=1 Tax=Caerostris extrusa TaxID=172846 RepID=A0AAV4Y3G5_CAEEX|nr:hypothetical protein CEXT_237571 [Caerostris extrusa]